MVDLSNDNIDDLKAFKTAKAVTVGQQQKSTLISRATTLTKKGNEG
jgi:hypothetical protein